MKYYPIGTVVILKGGDRPLMIYGRKQIQQPANLIWDYVACLYPEGNISDKYTFFFQQEEIEKVLYVGYWSQYEEKMQRLLNASSTGNVDTQNAGTGYASWQSKPGYSM